MSLYIIALVLCIKGLQLTASHELNSELMEAWPNHMTALVLVIVASIIKAGTLIEHNLQNWY